MLVAAVVVDVDHAGVVDGGHGAGLAAEPLGEAGLLQQRGQQDLDRDRTAEHLVGAAPDVAHAAAGDPLVEPVAVAELHPGAEHRQRPPLVGDRGLHDLPGDPGRLGAAARAGVLQHHRDRGDRLAVLAARSR